MEHFELIRRMVEVEKLSRREVARRLGHSRKTIEKALQNAAPVPYTLSRPRPKLQSFAGLIQAWLRQRREWKLLVPRDAIGTAHSPL